MMRGMLEMRDWISAGKGKSGLKYREHAEKTVGVARSKRSLRYYKTYSKFEGKFVTGVFGWEDEFRGGIHEIEKIALEIKINRKLKTPPFTYREMIAGNEEQLVKERAKEEAFAEEQELLTKTVFSNVFFCMLNQNLLQDFLLSSKGFIKDGLLILLVINGFLKLL